jgi:serine/threonine protein kinase/Tol biopolymer transport system component
MTGQTIGQYTILEKLGQGGMGVVYKAQDTKLDRFVALKFLPPHLNASAQDKARFTQEAKAAAALSHPNVCSIMDIQEHDGQLFIVMEFVDGQTLRERKDTLTLKQAIDIGVQVADGLAAAHEKGIVHRDIKPENIMIRRDGIAQIMDFGLAKLRSAGSAINRLTKEGSTIGTAGYMSPEQVQGLDADHRSDIFSLGVVLFEIFTGQLPFKGVHETALMYEIVNVDAPPPSSIRPEIDVELDRIVLDCLQKEKSERAQSAGEVSRDLKRFKRESGRQRVSRISSVRPAYAPAAVASPAPAASRRSAVLPWLIASGAVLAAVVLAVLRFTAAPPAAPPVMRTSILPDLRSRLLSSGALALSPDGSMLAFAAEDSTGVRLWVRPLRSAVPILLPGTEKCYLPFWSPDNKFIAFFTEGKLKKVEASGGSAVTICDAPGASGGSWGKDGTIIFTSLRTAGLFRVSSQGGTPTAITGTDTTNADLFFVAPSFLPDGKHFLYTSYTKPMVVTAHSEDNAIFVGSLDSPDHKVIMKGSSNAVAASGRILFARDNTLLAQEFDADRLEVKGEPAVIAEQVQFSERIAYSDFSASQTGMLVYQTRVSSLDGLLSVYDRSGKLLRSIGEASSYDDPIFSPDGSAIAYTLYEGGDRRGDIWIADLARGASSRFTFSSAEEDDPVFSPDGLSIAYSSEGDLALKPTGGVGEMQYLYRSKSDKVPTDWSRDGKYLVYGDFGSTSGRDLWVLPMTGDDKKPIPFATTEFTEQGGAFSPDGAWLAYSSNESGRFEVYIQSFPPGRGKRQVSTQGGMLPRWNRNGKELFFMDQGGEICVAPIIHDEPTLQVGTPSILFKTKMESFSGPGHRYDVSPDGLSFIINDVKATDFHAEPLSLIINWPSELSK